jgi:putative transposase
MRKTYQYRLYPTNRQTSILNRTLNLCRRVYNDTLAYRKHTYETDGKTASLYATNNLLTQWKQDNPTLKSVHSQVLQNVQVRVDLAYKAFFRRTKSGDVPGFPRFKGYGRYDSITYPQSGFHVTDAGTHLHASKIGDIPIVLHRPIDGTIKTLTIRRTMTGKWYASFSVEVEPDVPVTVPHNDKIVGIDVGLETFCTLSDGTTVENPRWFRKNEKALAKAQRKFSKLGKGTPERKKQRHTVAHIHEKIANRRKDFIYKLSTTLTRTYGTIVFEDLTIKNMMKNPYLAKSIGDAAWNFLISTTVNKAEEAGCTVVLINPKQTSQRCSQCGQLVMKTLKDRVHTCPQCGLVMNRDLNASINIMRLGLQSLG